MSFLTGGSVGKNTLGLRVRSLKSGLHGGAGSEECDTVPGEHVGSRGIADSVSPWLLCLLWLPYTQQLSGDSYSFCFVIVILFYFVSCKEWNSNRLLPFSKWGRGGNKQQNLRGGFPWNGGRVGVWTFQMSQKGLIPDSTSFCRFPPRSKAPPCVCSSSFPGLFSGHL